MGWYSGAKGSIGLQGQSLDYPGIIPAPLHELTHGQLVVLVGVHLVEDLLHPGHGVVLLLVRVALQDRGVIKFFPLNL